MAILNFVSQDAIDALDDDPRIAFMTLVNHAQQSLAEQTARLDPREEAEWEQREELRHSFMNVVIAAAKRLEIEPFASQQVPRLSDKKGFDYLQFKADLDHYVTQLTLDNSIRVKQDSVTILPISKDRIRAYVNSLRDCVEKANMTESKRDALLKKLAQFEEELEKRRLNMRVVARVAFELLAIPGAVWASVDVAHKLITNVMQTVAEAKLAEQETRQLAPTEPPKALSPPRNDEALPASGFGRQSPMDRASARRGGSASGGLDDDIPF